MLKRFLTILILILGLSLFAIEVEEWKWGFNGRAVEQNINPLSVMISNPMPIPFDGVITLRKKNHMEAPLGAPLVKKVFLGAYATRWVQFYPYVKDSYEEWALVWGPKQNQRKNIKVNVQGGKAIVYLTSSRNGRVKLPLLPENLFPPSVAATSGLIGIVIDKVPEFTPLQRQAFSDWLYSGGKVHIIEGPNGSFPSFGSDYSFLQITGKKENVGAGQVIKHSGSKFLNAGVLGSPKKLEVEKDRIYLNDSDDSFFRKLRSQLKTNHNWGFIFLISIVYGLLVTVANFIIGRKAKKTWIPLSFFAGTVIFFSLLLAWCGKRGYGEKSQIISLTYAKELDKNHFSLSQWMDIFVTDGDYYKISHKNNCNIYSDCQSMHPINGQIVNGSGGFFLVDIPLFSSMQLFHKSDSISVNNINIKSKYKFNGPELNSLDLTFSKDFPQPILEVKAVVNGNIYKLHQGQKWNEYELLLSSINNFSDYLRDWQNEYGYYGLYNQEEDPKKIFKSTIPALIIRSRGGDKVIDSYYPEPCALDDKIDIYVMAKTPDEFKTDREAIKKEEGYTLFHFVLP